MGHCKFSGSCTIRRAKGGKGRYAKQKGELAELVFVLKAASLGLAVCKPYGDSLPYDFVVGGVGRMLRVQVKSAFTHVRRGFMVHAESRKDGQKHLPYTADEIDLLAAYVVAHDAWYIIPVDAVVGRRFLRVYPDVKARRGGGRFEQFREAWHLITGVRPELPAQPTLNVCNEQNCL